MLPGTAAIRYSTNTVSTEHQKPDEVSYRVHEMFSRFEGLEG
jgi:hypothetical protein